MKLLHALFGTRRCKRRLVWRQNVLLCSECGRIAGFRYQIGDGEGSLRIFLFTQFADQYERIQSRADTHKIVQTSDVLGSISFVDFATAILEMKEKIADITYHGFDGLGMYVPVDDDWEEMSVQGQTFEETNDDVGDCDRDRSVSDDGSVYGADDASAS